MPYFTLRDETQIYYEDYGQGEPIIFLHGVSATHLIIKDFIDEFRDEYRCISYDTRGHGSSNQKGVHINLESLAQDLRELLEYLDLRDVTIVGHSLGSATTFSYVSQFGCDRIKRIIGVDMTPCGRNTDWKGGIARGEWTDDDFMKDMDRIFNFYPEEMWVITKDMCAMPALRQTPPQLLPLMIANCKDRCGCDPFTLAGIWYSVFRTDNRAAVEKITVPYMYIRPETAICGQETIDFIRDHVKGGFVLAEGFPKTTHVILRESPHEVAEKVKEFLKS